MTSILPEYNTKNVPTFTWPWVKHEKRYPVLDIIHAKILRKEKPARLAEQYHVFTLVKEH